MLAKPYWSSLVTRVATTFFDSSTAWANSADLPVAARVDVGPLMMQVHDHLGPPLVEQQPHRDRLRHRVLVDGGGVGVVLRVVEQVGVVAVDVVAATRLVEGGAARQAERVEVLPPRRRVTGGVLD